MHCKVYFIINDETINNKEHTKLKNSKNVKNKIIYKGIGVMSFYIFIYKCKEIYISCYLGVKLLSSQISD